MWCYREDSRFIYIDAQAAIKGSKILDQANEAVASQKLYESRVNWLRKTLDSVMAFKFFDFKRMAEAQGEQFDFDIKTLRARVVSVLEEYAESHNGKRIPGGIAAEDKDTVVSKVMKLSNDKAKGANIIYTRNPTSKYD